MLLRRLHVGDGGQRGLALGGGRAAASLLLAGFIILLVFLLGRIGIGDGIIEQRREARHAGGGGGGRAALLAAHCLGRVLMIYSEIVVG